MARLSTHVLDTSRGVPVEGIGIDVYYLAADAREHVKSAVTNKDGRTDEPLVTGEALRTGVYEICFEAGSYFRRVGAVLPDPPFLNSITVRFGIADPHGHYHVPLLVSPYGYTTYRGS